MFSFNTRGNDNCILAKASIGTYGVWVHWAMTIGSNNVITHYINGTASTAPRSTITYCNRASGSLVLGHDQVHTPRPNSQTDSILLLPRITMIVLSGLIFGLVFFVLSDSRTFFVN